MNETLTPEQNLEARAELFKALGHPVRLLILNLIKIKPRHGEELATILTLNPATVSHHLGKLSDVGLLRSEKDQYYQVYSLAGAVLDKPLRDVVFMPQTGVTAQVKEPGRTYTEREVNQVLVEFNDDVATLRRGLVDAGLLERENSIYWRGMDAETETSPTA